MSEECEWGGQRHDSYREVPVYCNGCLELSNDIFQTPVLKHAYCLKCWVKMHQENCGCDKFREAELAVVIHTLRTTENPCD